jgi:hypothetical protein
MPKGKRRARITDVKKQSEEFSLGRIYQGTLGDVFPYVTSGMFLGFHGDSMVVQLSSGPGSEVHFGKLLIKGSNYEGLLLIDLCINQPST